MRRGIVSDWHMSGFRLGAALGHYVDRVGLHEVSREPDGRAYLPAWDEFDGTA